VLYQPPRTLGLTVGAVLVLWSGGVAFLLLNAGISGASGWFVFLTYAGGLFALGLSAVFAYWTYALATLSYAMDRNGLVISWGPVRQIVPLQAIERLVPGTSAGVPRVHGISWWGHHVGNAQVNRLGPVLFYSAHQTPEQVLYVCTNERNYAISVEDAEEFAAQVQTRQDLGPTAQVSHRVERTGPLLETIAVDRRARWLVLGAVASAALVWLQIALRYDSLPAALELNWPPTSDRSVITVTGREAILELPRTATLLLALNLVLGVVAHAWDRMAGYLLLGAAIAVQVAMFVALTLALM
jgi:hypothetical protein